MATPVPPSVELAFQQLLAGFKSVGLNDLDPIKASWADIEKGVARLLGGPFNIQQQQHQAVALGLSAVLGMKLRDEFGAFWAANRESPDGMVLGFPDALVMLSPIGATMEALSRANLPQLEEIQKQIRTALGRARLSISGGGQPKLGPQDYERLFDPAFIQFVLLEDQKLKEAWESPLSGFIRNLREAIDRTSSQVGPEVKKQMDAQLLGALSSLDPQKPIVEQVAQAGRIVELVGHLGATGEATRPAPEDFWAAVAFPVLMIGDPATFPAFEDEEKQAIAQGVDPLFLFLDVTPYQFQADDEGLLGAISGEEIGLPHPALQGISPLRLLTVKLDKLGPALEKFDAAKSKAAFQRFVEHAKAQTGNQNLKLGQSEQVLNEAFMLVTELKKLWETRSKGKVALRRLTEAEAAGEPALTAIRKSMHGPRIILT